MELTGIDIDVLNAFFGKEPLKKLTIRGSFARGPLSLTRDVDLMIEMNYPPGLGPALASVNFSLSGILKLRLEIETSMGVRKNLTVFINKRRVLFFEE